MKAIKIITGALVSTLALGSLAFAQGTINQRERRQQARIHEGARDGEVTRNEARKLERQQAKIHAAEARAKADGNFTPRERAKIQKMQDKASHQIYREKHDHQTR